MKPFRFGSLVFIWLVMQGPTVFDRLKSRIKRTNKQVVEKGTVAVPKLKPIEVPVTKPVKKAVRVKIAPVTPKKVTPKVAVPKVPEVKPVSKPTVAAPTVAVHKTHKPLIIAIISFVAIGIIGILVFFGPNFVGKAIAGGDFNSVEVIIPGEVEVGQTVDALAGFRSASPFYGFKMEVESDLVLGQISSFDGDLVLDVETVDGKTIVRGFRQSLQAMNELSLSIPVTIEESGSIGVVALQVNDPNPAIAIQPALQMEELLAEEPAGEGAGVQQGNVQRQDAARARPAAGRREKDQRKALDGQLGRQGQGQGRDDHQVPGEEARIGQGIQGGEQCENKIDDDGDGMIDCHDIDDCGNAPICLEEDLVELFQTYEDYYKNYEEYMPTGETPYDLKKEGGEICADGFDNDGDGMVDCADSDCSQVPACSLNDGDNDGVPDAYDACPAVSGEGGDGCPPGDDNNDGCLTAAEAEACGLLLGANAECTADADGDGILDTDDGDIDNDGVNNADDADADNDGVEDALDLCPYTLRGEDVTGNGCSPCDVWDTSKAIAQPDGCFDFDDLTQMAYLVGVGC